MISPKHNFNYTTTLTEEELKLAKQLGKDRLDNMIKKNRAKWFCKEDTLPNNILGAEGEIAACKVLRQLLKLNLIVDESIYKDYNDPNRRLDVSLLDHPRIGFEIRTVKSEKLNLLLKKYDEENTIYILVEKVDGVYKLIGFINSTDGKLEKYWRENMPDPCFLINRNKLKPIKDLAALFSHNQSNVLP